jgi:hypothetical protein
MSLERMGNRSRSISNSSSSLSFKRMDSLLPPLPPRNFVVVGAEIEKEEEEEGKGGREGEKEGGKDAIPIEEVGEGLREGGEGRVEVVEEGGNQACRGKGKRWSKNQNYQIN